MKYYVENVERGVVRNCLLWWKIGGHGYTCDLSQAHVFDVSDPQLDILRKNKKYRVWEKSYIDSRTSIHVDMQILDSYPP